VQELSEKRKSHGLQAAAEAQIAALAADRRRKNEEIERLEARTDSEEKAIVRDANHCFTSHNTHPLPVISFLARLAHCGR
jgi:molecular chaperone GrpE (heat shock protein)